MTQEEVKRILKENNITRDDVSIWYRTDGIAEFTIWNQKLAERILKLLDKQIPRGIDWKDGGNGILYSSCPRCGRPVCFEQKAYCDCGQKVDWGIDWE